MGKQTVNRKYNLVSNMIRIFNSTHNKKISNLKYSEKPCLMYQIVKYHKVNNTFY